MLINVEHKVLIDQYLLVVCQNGPLRRVREIDEEHLVAKGLQERTQDLHLEHALLGGQDLVSLARHPAPQGIDGLLQLGELGLPELDVGIGADQEQVFGADHLVDDRQDIVERALDNQAVGVVALRNGAHRGRGHVDVHAAPLQVIDRLIGREGHAALRTQEEATVREAEKKVMTQICLGRKLRDACR